MNATKAFLPRVYSKKRLLLWFLIGILLFWHANELRKSRDGGQIPLYDFVEYWSACRVFLAGGNPYGPSELLTVQRNLGWTDSSPIMMWNPPWIIPLLLPFSWLPFWTSRGLWFVIHLSLILITVDWFWRQYGGSASKRWISWLAALFFLPAGTALFLGQITPLVLIGAAGFLWALSKKSDAWAGASTLLISIKPHLLYLFWIFLIFWIWRNRRWKILAWAAGSLGLASLLVVIINPATFANYVEAVRSPSGPVIWHTPTWGMALMMMFPGSGGWIRFLPSVLGILVAGWLWSQWRTEFDWQSHWPVITLLSVTTSSFTWMFDWVVLLPVVVLLLCWFVSRPKQGWWLPLAMAAMQPLLILPEAVKHSNFYTLWLPPALWLLYCLGSAMQLRRQKAGGTAQAPFLS